MNSHIIFALVFTVLLFDVPAIGSGQSAPEITNTMLLVSEDAFIDSQYDKYNYGDYAVIGVVQTVNFTWRSFLKFASFDTLKIEMLLSAKLQLRLHSGSGYASKIYVYDVTDTWNEKIIMWNNRPAMGYTSTTGTVNPLSPMLEIDVTAIAMQWRGSGQNYGLALKLNESYVDAWLFYSRETDYGAVLIVQYYGLVASGPSAWDYFIIMLIVTLVVGLIVGVFIVIYRRIRRNVWKKPKIIDLEARKWLARVEQDDYDDLNYSDEF